MCVIRFTFILCLFTTICFSQVEIDPEKNKVYVFIVGVTDYNSSYWKLKTANLEDKIKEVTEGLYNELEDKPYIEKVVLLDSISETTTSYLDNAISNQLRQIDEKGLPSVVLFFFIGHGKYIKDDDFYIITSDAKDVTGKGSFGILRDYLSHVNRFLKKSHVLTFIDACSSGGIENLQELNTIESELKNNGVLHYMLTSTNDERPAFATIFSKSILKFIQDKNSKGNDLCELSFSKDATEALIPYTKKIYLEEKLPTEGLSQKKYIPISTFRSDKFCLDSFRGIKGCAAIGNNQEVTVTYKIVDKSGNEITNGKLLAGRNFWFFGFLETEYIVKCNMYDSFMREIRSLPEFTLKFTSEKPVLKRFVTNNNQYGIEYAELSLESGRAAKTIGVDEEIITATVAEANLIKKLVSISDNEGYAFNNRIDNVLKKNSNQLASTTWSKENGNWYLISQSGEKTDFKHKVRELLAESRFKEASEVVHKNYLYTGEKEKFELSRNLELAYLGANAVRKEDSIISFYNAGNMKWDNVTENAMPRLSSFPELENINNSTSQQILEELRLITVEATEKVVKWISIE